MENSKSDQDRIRFESKEESNARREREFLALSPSDRFLSFLRGFDLPNGSSDAPTGEQKGNFIVRRKRDEVRG